jgi:ubiquinone/menaquinone biosynthesis C-methylase UbiE
MLRRTPNGYPRTIADAARLPFKTASYDVVVMAFVLFHVPSPRRRSVKCIGCSGLAAAWA